MGQGAGEQRGLELVKKTTDKRAICLWQTALSCPHCSHSYLGVPTASPAVRPRDIWFSSSTPAHISSVTGSSPPAPCPETQAAHRVVPPLPLLVVHTIREFTCSRSTWAQVLFPKVVCNTVSHPTSSAYMTSTLIYKKWIRFHLLSGIYTVLATGTPPLKNSALPTQIQSCDSHGIEGLAGCQW